MTDSTIAIVRDGRVREHNGKAVIPVAEAAEIKRVLPQAVRKALDRPSSGLKGVKLYGEWHVYEESLRDWIPVYGRGNFRST